MTRYRCWVCESEDVFWIDPTGIASWCRKCWDSALAIARGDIR